MSFATQTLSGSTWREALTAWSQGGGALTEVRLEATAGEDFARGQSDRLTADANGRLQGSLAANLRGGTAPILPAAASVITAAIPSCPSPG